MSATSRSIKAGVIGVGSLGYNHARIYSDIDGVEKLFLFDSLSERSSEAASKFGAEVCSSADELLSECDLVSVCTPATDHFATTMKAFERGVHVLVEKPIASDTASGREMVRTAAEKGLVFQTGHIERFNGTFDAVKGVVKRPLFIESHRLGTFTPRGIDVSVVVDLMIHDIDIVLTLIGNEEITDLRASGAGILTSSPDIVNARLEFERGCVANLTASRISREPLRKVRIFQENMYISADFRAREVEAFSRAEGVSMSRLEEDPTAFIRRLDIEVDRKEPLRREIESFVGAALSGDEPVVSGVQALRALEVAEMILEKVERNMSER